MWVASLATGLLLRRHVGGTRRSSLCSAPRRHLLRARSTAIGPRAAHGWLALIEHRGGVGSVLPKRGGSKSVAMGDLFQQHAPGRRLESSSCSTLWAGGRGRASSGTSHLRCAEQTRSHPSSYELVRHTMAFEAAISAIGEIIGVPGRGGRQRRRHAKLWRLGNRHTQRSRRLRRYVVMHRSMCWWC